MNGYTHLFNESESRAYLISDSSLDSIFQSFRIHRDLYGYTDNGDTPPDDEYICVSTLINEKLYHHFVKQLLNRPFIGYNGSSSYYAIYNNLDSRHILFSVILSTFINKKIHEIIEIGGGYGNMLYLNRNQDFTKWTIIDLPHILKLQKWCLDQLQVNSSLYDQYSAHDYTHATSKKYDVVIGTHSLSEFSMDIFNQYFNSIIKNSTYLLYSYHKYYHRELVELKRNYIEQYFDLVYEVDLENNNVSTCLFINKMYN